MRLLVSGAERSSYSNRYTLLHDFKAQSGSLLRSARSIAGSVFDFYYAQDPRTSPSMRKLFAQTFLILFSLSRDQVVPSHPRFCDPRTAATSDHLWEMWFPTETIRVASVSPDVLLAEDEWT